MIAALIALLTAIVLDIFWGELPNRFHPVAVMGKYIGWISNNFNRGNTTIQFFSGSVTVFLGGLLFSIPVLIITLWMRPAPDWLEGILMGALLKPMFAFRGLLNAGREVQQALIVEDLEEARRLVGWSLVSRDTSRLSAAQVASAVIESLSENFTDSFLAPLLFFAIGGLPAAWFYRFVNTADAMIGYHTPQFEYFGKFTAWLDDLLNWLPARLAGGILVVSAALLRMDAKAAWRVMLSQHSCTSSPNAGWTMAAAAGTLQVILEKTECYRLGSVCQLPSAPDITRAIRLVKAAWVVSIFMCVGVIIGTRLLF